MKILRADYQVLIQKIQGKDKFVKNTYSVKKKNFEIAISRTDVKWELRFADIEGNLKIPETAKTKETIGIKVRYFADTMIYYYSKV